jgi:hypothetical protein
MEFFVLQSRSLHKRRVQPISDCEPIHGTFEVVENEMAEAKNATPKMMATTRISF